MADEQINVKITSDYKDDDAKAALKDAEQIEKSDPEITISADNSDAEKKITEVADASGRLSHDDTVLVIKAKIDAAKADVETLQTKLHEIEKPVEIPVEVDEVGGGVDGVRSKVQGLEGDTGRAKDTMHSFSGGMAGEAASMAGALGPVGEGISQITEGLLAGEVAAGELVAAMLPVIAVVGPAFALFKGISAAHERIKKLNAFDDEQIKSYNEALKKGLTTAEAIEEVLTNAGKIEFRLPGDFGKADITGFMATAGISVDQFATLVAGSEQNLRDWAAAEKAAGIEVGPVVLAVEDQRTKMQAATDQQRIYNTVFGDTQSVTAETARETERLNHAYVDGSAALADLNPKTKDFAHHVDTAAENTAKLNEQYRLLTGKLDEQEGWENVNQAIKDYNENTKHSDEDTRNLIRSIAEYVIATDSIPESKKTEILAELNAGDVAAAEATLDNLARQRDIRLLITAVGSKDTIKFLKSISRGGTGILDESDGTAAGTGSFAPSAPQTINVNLPRAARSGDIARALNVTQRRSGTRFQGVAFAKR